MKHHANGRPIGKCKGCCLNLRRLCAAGLEPKTVWSRGRCGRYNDQALLAACLEAGPPVGAKAAKHRRRRQAIRKHTEPHHNGVGSPARRGLRASGRP